ncbi:MAG TPA: hypothetical protein VFX48_01265, partial [Saprospiraceae bacterium]|nr:hypothetical protein [Saprospiraceae bacterium]
MGTWRGWSDTFMVVNREGMPHQVLSVPGDLGTIPFGAKIVQTDSIGLTDTIQYRTGLKIDMKFKGQNIWAYTGFLTNLKVPDLNDEDVNCQNLR